MVIELDYRAPRTPDPIVGRAARRTPNDLETPAEQSGPPKRPRNALSSTDSAGVGDPDIRVSLSPAARRSVEIGSSDEAREAASPPPRPISEREEPESTPRRRVIDAYQEVARAPRGERLQIVA